ncbi:unnamed protein product [Coffea canephora]|uniref:DH200=94 genomic scaffold, scaffold_171 n=1 Tax=Coffea canephora TaxID=49390 RepID=A0A068VAB7_COFCA|nr:unnamed protein product [Coffea canephora]
MPFYTSQSNILMTWTLSLTMLPSTKLVAYASSQIGVLEPLSCSGGI